MLGGTTMLPKKISLDVTNKGIIPILETQIFTPFHEPTAAHDDLANVMSKSTGSSTDRNSHIDDYTPNTRNQNPLYRFGTTKSTIREHSKLRP